MNFKQCLILLISGTVLGVGTRGQDLPVPEAEIGEGPTFSTTHFKFVDIKETLKMMEEAVAANESILAKQKETLSQLAELETRAQAAKSAAAKSLSRHK
jgi:hypothetical protein